MEGRCEKDKLLSFLFFSAKLTIHHSLYSGRPEYRLLVDSYLTHKTCVLQLHNSELDRWLPKGSEGCEELLKSSVSQPLPEDMQEEKIQSQFVFRGQCLVLGDARVGKTSLVRSLTGEPFDPRQEKTQGIEERLVDKEWKTLDTKKDLAFGIFSSFFKAVSSQLMLLRKDGRVTLLVSLPLETLKLIVVLFVIICILNASLSSHLRHLVKTRCHGIFILATAVSLIAFLSAILLPRIAHRFRTSTYIYTIVNEWTRKPRFLTIGVFLSVMTKCYVDEICCACQMIIHVGIALSIGTIGVLLFFVFLFLKGIIYKATEIKWCHPCQHKFIASKVRPMEVMLFYEFVWVVCCGYVSCQYALSLIEVNFEFTCGFAVFASYVWHFFLAIVLALRLYELLSGIWYRKLALIVFGIVFLSFGLVLLPAVLYFVIIYVTFSCYNLYIECSYMNMKSPVGAINNNAKQDDHMFNSAIFGDEDVLDMTKSKSELNRKFSYFKMKLLDFAGDKEYYSYHHLFLRHHGLYIIVFNMAEFADMYFRDISRHIQRLQFWMESICSHVPRRTPILLVGTHRGNMDNKCIKILDDHLKQFLWKKYCDELVANDAEMLLFFPVENSLENMDNGIQALQREIISVAEQNKETIGREIPLSWIQVQDAIINLKENPNARFCLKLCEFQRTIDNVVCHACIWSKETLEYFHEKGLIIYVDKKEDVDLSNWILLKPKILVDIVIQLITPSTESTQHRGLRHDWGLLQRKGILTKALLQSIICKVKEDEEAITAFLEQYDLICPLEYKRIEMKRGHHCDVQATHFVPSLLPLSADGDKPVWHDHYTDKKFYVLFSKFLPEALFHRLLSRAQKNSNVEFPNGQTVLYRDAGKFWMNPYLNYKLKLMEEEKMIEIAYNSRYMKKV